MKTSIYFIVFLTFGFTIHAQTNVNLMVDNYVKATIEKRSTSDQLKQILLSDNLQVFYAILPSLSDSTAETRAEAYRLLSALGYACKDAAVRKRIVKQMIKGCRDKDSGICGMELNSLTHFLKDDFDKEAAYELSLLTKQNLPHYHILIKLTGFVGIPDLITVYRQMLAEKKYPNSQSRWALHLALARMGEQDEIDYCVQKVRKTPINDDVVYELLPDLIYTRQKNAFDYLLEIIESNDENCSSSNADSNVKIVCAYRIMEQIAPCIENFPVETGVSGDLKTSNYDTALAKVREWIKLNKESYVIKTDSF